MKFTAIVEKSDSLPSSNTGTCIWMKLVGWLTHPLALLEHPL